MNAFFTRFEADESVPTANPLNQRAPFARRKTKSGTEIY